jgi:hypothetical protein
VTTVGKPSKGTPKDGRLSSTKKTKAKAAPKKTGK